MHAPSEYYRAKNTPYPIINPTPEPGFIWTNLRPVKHDLDNNENIEELS